MAEKETAPAPVAAASALDPHLGKRLRDQLLEEFGLQSASSKDNPPPPRQPTAGKESFEWEASKEWENKGI